MKLVLALLLSLSAMAIKINDNDSSGLLVYLTTEQENTIAIELENPQYSGSWESGVVNFTVDGKELEISYQDGFSVQDFGIALFNKLLQAGFNPFLMVYDLNGKVVAGTDAGFGPINNSLYQGKAWKATVELLD
jgi:hypothetical protein